MYVVFAEELEDGADLKPHTVQSLEQAFARIACRCGYNYHFEPRSEEGWALVLTDVERPERSPDPILSDYKKMDDAKHDLLAQAVDGRLRGHIAAPLHMLTGRRAVSPAWDAAPLFAHAR